MEKARQFLCIYDKSNDYNERLLSLYNGLYLLLKDEIWRSIHDTYLTGYTQEFSDVDAEEAVKKIINKLHEDYLESTGKKHDYNTFI